MNYFEHNKQASFKKKKNIKNERNCANLSDDYCQSPVESSENLVKDELTKKLGAVKTVSMADIVQGPKGCNVRLYLNVCKHFETQ